MRMDASKRLSHQDMNPTDIDRISMGGSFEDVRRALLKWEQKRYPERPKYGRVTGRFCKFGEGVLLAEPAKKPVTKQEKNAKRMAGLKEHWAKLSPEEKALRREKINERRRINRKKK